MSNRKVLAAIIIFVCLAVTVCKAAGLSEKNKDELFRQANQAFRKANSVSNPDQANRLYQQAVLAYEKIINEGRVQNAKLFYNLANAYLLKQDLGRAILNYRRAIKLDSADANIKKNLDFARSRRIDKIQIKTEKRILKTLFFWHYDFSIKTRFILSCVFFGLLCLSLAWLIWLARRAPAVTSAVVAGILMICFAASVGLEAIKQANTVCGVIVAESIIARQGDGQNYPASFKEPLHSGTEFDLIERRPGWLHIRLTDDSDGWITDNAGRLL